MNWLLHKDSLELLKLIITIKQPKHILEIGTFNGTTIKILSKITNAKITTIEKDDKFHKEAVVNLAECSNITLIKGNAKEEIAKLTTTFDIIFIDAMKREYIDYIKLLETNNLIKSNTIIIADNTISHKEKLKEYLDYVKSNYNSTSLNIGDGIEISIKE